MELTAQYFIEQYKLETHPEGGYFGETYTSAEELGVVQGDRRLAGSIYFLLDKGDISHFHVIDCEEIWYYHYGCGLKVWLIMPDGSLEVKLLGLRHDEGEEPMVVIPKGVIFAAENLAEDGFTFVSCVTTPKFTYAGFRLVPEKEVKESFPSLEVDSRLFI